MSKGRYGIHGGQYISETLMNELIHLEECYEHYKKDPEFNAELNKLLNEYAGRPSLLYYAEKMTKDLGGAKIYLKREDLNHTGSHKINNALGQALLAKKMGKTQKGAVWLDPNKTTPFEFYQYWRNVSDADVLKCLRMLTFLPLEQIDEMDKWEGSQLNQAKEILAYELTNLVHGEEEAKKAQESARALFTGGNAAEMPTSELTEADFTDGKIDILSVLVKSGLSASRSEARRAVEQGGVVVADEKVTDVKTAYDPEQFDGEGLVVRRGKKNFKRVVMK